MSEPRVLLLHGLGHFRPREHWLWWIAEELRQLRIPVQYPQFPTPDAPDLERWLALAEAELEQLNADPGAERIVVAHSLGTVLWLHLAARGARVDRALLVAPPENDRLVHEMSTFAVADLDVPAAVAAVPVTLVARTTDPYRSIGVTEHTQGWDAVIHELPGEGHLNTDDGHGPFPAALRWVQTGTFTPE